MSVKRRIQLRRCAICGKAGHNRAKCLLSVEKEERQKMAEISENIKLSKPAKSVFVKTFHTHPQSPHVVNLKKSENRRIWTEMPVFQEKLKNKEERAVVDLAAMVRRANFEDKSQVRVLARQEFKNKKNIRKILFRQNGIPLATGIKYLTNINEKRIAGQITNYRMPGSRRNVIYHLSFITDSISETAQGIRTIIIEAGAKLRAYFQVKKLAYAFIIVLVIIALPFPAIGYYRGVKNTSAKVVVESANAFFSLQSSAAAAFQADLSQAENDLNVALTSFDAVDEILNNEHQLLRYAVSLLPVVGAQVKGRQHLLTAGHHLALGNTYLVKGLAESEKAGNITDRFIIFANHLRSAIPQYQEALAQLSAVETKILPTEYQQPFSEFKLLFVALIDDLDDLLELSRSIETIFGSEQLRRYLLVFQNQHELRPTGGFMGSFAIMDVQKGKIINLDISAGGTYDLQGQLDVYLKPPLPLQVMNKRWEFQDANWFSDFAASAKKIEWFYEHGRNTTVDGVMAINASVLERLLKVMGPVASAKHDLVLNEGEATEKLQYQVEKNYDQAENRPKEVLGELARQFLSKAQSLDAVSAVRLLTELHSALEQKEIQLYFNNPGEQEHFRQFGWTGEILKIGENQDYLAVIGANLQGQKTDAKIKQVIEHQAAVQEDGSVIDTVVIHRRHLGTPGEMFYGANNIQYIRVYAPEGSELLAAGGFVYPPEEAFKVPEEWYQNDSDLEKNEQEIKIHAESGTRITKEFGKTVFGNWQVVRPGEASSVYFTYRLPFKVKLGEKKNEGLQGRLDDFRAVVAGRQNFSSHYSLLAQKQSGTNSDFSTRLIYPAGWQPVWQANNKMDLAVNGAEFSTVLDTDQVVGVVMEKI